MTVPLAMNVKDSKMTKFSDLGLSEKVLQAVTAEGYTQPTPIQAEVIPAMMSGRDVVGIAQTGTGKTASFVLPILHKIAKEGIRPEPKSCSVLILTPTRELAAQIADNIGAYGRFIRHSKTVVVGGAKAGPQIRAIARGLDVIVATPGRLEDHMSSGVVRLDRTTTVILDEADQMMDLGFMPAIRRILAKTPKKRQTVLMSATMPKQIRGLAKDFLYQPAEISVAPQSRPIERIDQKVFFVDKPGKRQLLVDLLGGADVVRAIVFTRTKHGADKVMIHLQRAGFGAAAIHGNKSQRQRERTLAEFKSGRVNILVATDIAARGIDVDDISHVVNFELPNIAESYVHRIGRTARAGKSGVAISLCDNSERSFLRDIERLTGTAITRESQIANDPLLNYEPGSPADGQRAVPAHNRNHGENRRPNPAGGDSEKARYGKKRKFRGKPKSGKPGHANHVQSGNGHANQGQASNGRANGGRPQQGHANQGHANQGRSNGQANGQSNGGHSNGGNSNGGNSNGGHANNGQANHGPPKQNQPNQNQAKRGNKSKYRGKPKFTGRTRAA